MEIVLYKLPGASVKKMSGQWKSTPFTEIKDNTFFVSTFSKDKCFEFRAIKEEKRVEVSNFGPPAMHTEDKAEYLTQLASFQNKFNEKGIEKAIYSRLIQTPFSKNPEALFDQLCLTYPAAFVYLISSPLFGTWIGATPETLLSFKDGVFSTMSLAGTKKEESSRWTNKEIEEQGMVTEYITNRLEKLSLSNLTISPTYTTYTGAVYHLKTDISFQAPLNKWNTIANALHPTPAVCGIPTEKAYAHILETEQHNRAFYAGVIGFQQEKELNTFVNLRCLQVHDKFVSLYVGGGITPKSIPEAEYEETENKAQTLLRVMAQLS